MSEILWQPSAAQIDRARVTAFRREVNRWYELELRDFVALYDWSVNDPQRFWSAVWRFCGVTASRTGTTTLVDGDRLPGARWFADARLNFAENLLRWPDDHEAIIFRREDGLTRRLSFAKLRHQVCALAESLRADGVGVGDRVAGYLPNFPETIIAMLATASLGAVWSSCSPDFGTAGVRERFGQIAPKVLFCADGYRYNGTVHDTLDRVRRLLDDLPSVERVVVVPYVDSQPVLTEIRAGTLWSTYVTATARCQPDYRQLPFDHPLYIMYSSGTTGLPKCLVHSAGGTLLQHLKEHVLHVDLWPGDRLFYFTTCGWMMWNWLVSGLASGATVMLYDGSPMHSPTGSAEASSAALWDFVAEFDVSIFGTSPKYLAACQKAGLRPGRTHDLPALATILSTGSPLAPETFDWVYNEVKADLRLSSISGGTDIISCFALGAAVQPVRRGELQTRGLGMDVAVFDDAGEPVVGQPGELVCRAPFPSVPSGFWNDDDGARFHAAYFDRFPGVWTHGDWAELRDGGSLIIHGRSDAVLNPGGVRIGTAEIYRVVESFDEVLESVAVGQRWDDDVRVVLFVVLKEGLDLDEVLRDRLRAAIRDQETPRHVPAVILQTPAIPRTISGKITELAVREVIHGRPVKNEEALANPDALAFFRDRPELQRGEATG